MADGDDLAPLDRRVSVLIMAAEGYERERRTRTFVTLDGLKLLQAHASAVADAIDVVLAEWFGDDEEPS